MTLPPKLEKLFENWRPIVVSLVAAILVYAFYQISMLETRYFVVPLEIKQNAGMVATTVSESSIKVSIRGNATDINTIEAKDFAAFADMKRFMKDGTEVVSVQLDLADNIRIMNDVEITLQPETVEVTLEKEISSYTPVELHYAGSTAHGYEIESITTIPSLIKVRGPESLVDSLTSIETDVVLFDGLTQSETIEVNLLALYDQLIADHEGPVTVSVKVVPSQMNRVLSNLPVVVRSEPENLTVLCERDTANLTITGNELDIEGYTPSANLLFIDCSEITEPGEYDLPVQYQKSSKFSVDTLVPETIRVVVTEKLLEEVVEDGE